MMSHRIIFKKNLILTFTKEQLVPFYFFLLLTFGVYLDLGTFWDGGAKLELNSSQINVFFSLKKTWRIWLINPDIFLKSEPSWGAYPHTALVLFVLLFKLVSPAFFFVIRHDQMKWFRVNITWNVAMWDFQKNLGPFKFWWPCTFGDKGKLRGQVYWKSFESQLMCLNRPLRNNRQWSIITVWSCMLPWLEGVIMASGEVGVSGTAVPGAT